MDSCQVDGCDSRSDSRCSPGGQVTSQGCFGVDPRKDGSITVASQEGEAVSIEHFPPEQAARIVQFVREKSRSPRVCIASTGGQALHLALAFGELPQAEVILLRPAALPHTGEAASEEKSSGIALALARYARRAA